MNFSVEIDIPEFFRTNDTLKIGRSDAKKMFYRVEENTPTM